MGSTDGQPKVPNAPWKPSAVGYSIGYALGFIGSATVASVSGAFIAGQHPMKALMTSPLVFPCLAVSLFGLWRLLADTYAVQNWWGQRIATIKPWWYLLLVAVATGSVAGIAFGALSWVVLGREKNWGWVPLVPLLLCPVLGLIWLLSFRPASLVDSDYDDEMSNTQLMPRGIPILLDNLAATESFGRRLGSLLFPNAVVALIGPLGAGKTHLSRAIAEGLGVANPAAVTSPTFTLIHEYPARLPIYHFDAYRLINADQFLDLGATEYYEAGGVCLIEWADRVEAALPEERLTIRIEIVDESRRRIEISANGEKYKQLVARMDDAKSV